MCSSSFGSFFGARGPSAAVSFRAPCDAILFLTLVCYFCSCSFLFLNFLQLKYRSKENFPVILTVLRAYELRVLDLTPLSDNFWHPIQMNSASRASHRQSKKNIHFTTRFTFARILAAL